MAESISAVVPFRNRSVEDFEVCLYSMQRQTRLFDEIIVVDIMSDEPFKTKMRKLCKSKDVDYHRIDIDAPEKAIEVFLWNTCHNYGLRLAKSDLVCTTGCDRIYERNLVKVIVETFNRNKEHTGRGTVMTTGIRNLLRTPSFGELEDFDKLMHEAKWRGGYGFLCASRLWLGKVHGFDEELRWYEDIDLAVRAKYDGLHFTRLCKGKIRGRAADGEYRMLHMAWHKKKVRKSYAGKNVLEIARLGKRCCKGGQSIIKNDENWGVLTKEKIEKAIRRCIE